jgi:Fe-S cluster biogenesis protein NfuA
MKEQVEAALEEVALGLRMDGGDIELVDIDEDNVVHVRMKGACHGCPRAQMTLKMYVEQWLMERVPEVTGVEQVLEVMA